MNTLKSYCDQIYLKSLIVFCNDCFRTSEFIADPRFVVTTAFANLVSPKNGFDKKWFERLARDNGIEQIIIAGHCDCQVIQFLFDDESNNPHWKEAQILLNQLQGWLGRYSEMSEADRLKFMVHYTTLQVQIVNGYMEKIGLDMEVKGIVIDENHRNVIKEIDLDYSPRFINSLN